MPSEDQCAASALMRVPGEGTRGEAETEEIRSRVTVIGDPSMRGCSRCPTVVEVQAGDQAVEHRVEVVQTKPAGCSP
jgi:hypothetical protein